MHANKIFKQSSIFFQKIYIFIIEVILIKSKFVTTTLILLAGGFITKILGMIIKIVMTRLIGTNGIGLYMLIMPTFNLFITICQLGLSVAISKLVAEDKNNNKQIVFSSTIFSCFFNIFLIILIVILAPIISDKLLHNNETYYSIIAIALTLPFISISSILRGYFFGKQRMFPHTFSNCFEQILRLISILIITPYLIPKGLNIAIAGIILTNIISELSSILILFFFVPKNFKLTKKDLHYSKSTMKDILSISIPTTSSRILGSIGYFFEPIILTSTLLMCGYSNDFIVTEYGIINGYVLQLLLLPSFFTMAISQALLPVVSKAYSSGNINYTKSKIKQAIKFSLLIGIPATIIFLLFPEFFLKLIYNTNEGIKYIKVLAPICILHYIQAPLSSSLQAMGKAKDAMYGTIIGIIVRTSLLFVLSLLKIGMWGLVISTGINIVFVTLFDLSRVKKHLK